MSEFEKWWSKHPLRNERITADDVMAAWDAAVDAEREACAKIADEWGSRKDQMTDTAFVPGADHGERFASDGIAATIRARSTEA